MIGLDPIARVRAAQSAASTTTDEHERRVYLAVALTELARLRTEVSRLEAMQRELERGGGQLEIPGGTS